MQLNLPRDPLPDRYSHVRWISAGERVDYATFDGPGCIQHIWLTATRHEMGGRQVIIRIYFDDSPVPHVEAPVGDFFGVMHGKRYYPLNTRYLSAVAETGWNCYFPMPFAKSARIEFEADPKIGNSIYMMVDWHRYDEPLREERRFCARWRRELPTKRYDREYLVLDAKGQGNFLGFFYGVRLLDDVDRWSHGGADNHYIDGMSRRPAYVRGIGGEDTFGTSYGGAIHSPVESQLYQGMPYYVHEDTGEARVAQRLVGYRFFEHDSIPFKESIQMRFGCMENDICSTAYWYQSGAVKPFCRLPSFEQMQAMPRHLGEVRDADKMLGGSLDVPAELTGSWWICGPFGLTADAMTGALAAERAFNPAEMLDGGHEQKSPYLSESSARFGRDKARWHRFDSIHGFVDFNHRFRCTYRGVGSLHPAIGVARASLLSPRAQTAKITLGWDDELVLSVNGERIDTGSHRAFRSKTIDVALRAGENPLCVKQSNTRGSNHGGWAFSFFAQGEDGAALIPNADKLA